MNSIIEAEGVGRTYRNGPRALDSVDLAVQAGSFFALLGPNGAGKSTLTRILCTLSRPDSGSVRIDGIPLSGNTARVRRRIGVALQDVTVDPSSTVRGQLTFQGRLFGLGVADARRRTDSLLERFGLVSVADRKAGELSGGNKRRLHVTLALVHQPAILFLDEPTTGMDPEARIGFWNELRRLNREDGTTIFFTTQYLEEAEKNATDLAIIEGGTVAYRGTVDGFIADNRLPDGGNLEDGYLQFLKARRGMAAANVKEVVNA